MPEVMGLYIKVLYIRSFARVVGPIDGSLILGVIRGGG